MYLISKLNYLIYLLIILNPSEIDPGLLTINNLNQQLDVIEEEFDNLLTYNLMIIIKDHIEEAKSYKRNLEGE
jgi:hypothetical protein